MNPSEILDAKVHIDRVLYPRDFFDAGDFAIVSCLIDEVVNGEPYNDERIVIKGKVFSLDQGATYQLRGKLTSDDRYGYSYWVKSFNEDCSIDTIQEQNKYLSLVLTERQFDLLTENLADPFKMLLDKNVKALTAISGIGQFSAQKIIEKFHARLNQAKAFNVLSNYGMSMAAITTLLGKFTSADALLAMVEENPYIMIKEVDGIGWARADAIALGKGMAPDDPKRICAYIRYFLECRADDGHTWCIPQELWDAASYDLKLDSQDKMREAFNLMHDRGELWWSEDRSQIALSSLRHMEERIAKELRRIVDGEPLKPATDAEVAIKEMELRQGWEFTDEQMDAIQDTLDSNVSILVGLAGTGKSSAVSAVLKLLQNHTFAQCALSGRAAARLAEVTGEKGSTIHRLLGFMNGEFAYTADFPLPYDIIILDEISMVGAEIFLRLLEAIPTGSKLIMLGDDGQLESIGLCNIFKDMLESGVVPVGRLTKIHRQAARSAIITESIKVRNGIQLCPSGWVGREVRGELQDLDFEVYGDAILTFDNIFDKYKELIAQGISRDQIQVIVPMKTRGEACTHKLNVAIQSFINPEGRNHKVDVHTKVSGKEVAYELRLGDRVICTQNMYKAERPVSDDWDDIYEDDEYESASRICPVYNGDRGKITRLADHYIIINFDLWGDIIIKRADFNKIELGYALSCHKLQGSEADYVIIGFDFGSRILLTREWLYTAITRAKKHCILTCEGNALQYCIATSHVPYKRTFLAGLLKGAFSERSKDQDE